MGRGGLRGLEVCSLACAALVLCAMWAGTAIECAPYVMTAFLSFGVTMHALIEGKVD